MVYAVIPARILTGSDYGDVVAVAYGIGPAVVYFEVCSPGGGFTAFGETVNEKIGRKLSQVCCTAQIFGQNAGAQN